MTTDLATFAKNEASRYGIFDGVALAAIEEAALHMADAIRAEEYELRGAIAHSEREAIAAYIETWDGRPKTDGARRRLANDIRDGKHWQIPPQEDTGEIHTHEIGGEG